MTKNCKSKHASEAGAVGAALQVSQASPHDDWTSSSRRADVPHIRCVHLSLHPTYVVWSVPKTRTAIHTTHFIHVHLLWHDHRINIYVWILTMTPHNDTGLFFRWNLHGPWSCGDSELCGEWFRGCVNGVVRWSCGDVSVTTNSAHTLSSIVTR